MKSLLLLCPNILKPKLISYLSTYKDNRLKFCIAENDQKNNNLLQSVRRDKSEVKVKDLLTIGIVIDTINTVTPDALVPLSISVDRRIKYPYNYNLRVSEEIKRCIQDAVTVGYSVEASNDITDIISSKTSKVTGIQNISLSPCSDMEINGLANNYILIGDKEEILDPLGIISPKITAIRGDKDCTVGFCYGKVIRMLENFGYNFIDFS